jgi:enoyl-CoA hydratase/carnithine racemase
MTTTKFGAFISKEQRGRVALVRFDRGDGRNAMSREVMRQLTAVAQSFEEDAQTSAIVLTGDPRSFCVGYDLRDAEAATLATAGLAERRQGQTLGARLCRAWASLGPLTIVAIEGHCIGGGLALAVACDLRIASNGAKLSIPEIDRGMNMTWGSLPRLVSLIGPARTKRLVILGQAINGEEARSIGLVDETTQSGSALDRALAIAEEVAAKPPLPVRMNKLAINAAASLNEATAAADFDQLLLCQGSEDFREGVASFLEKRKPRFTGR